MPIGIGCNIVSSTWIQIRQLVFHYFSNNTDKLPPMHKLVKTYHQQTYAVVSSELEVPISTGFGSRMDQYLAVKTI